MYTAEDARADAHVNGFEEELADVEQKIRAAATDGHRSALLYAGSTPRRMCEVLVDRGFNVEDGLSAGEWLTVRW